MYAGKDKIECGWGKNDYAMVEWALAPQTKSELA